MHEKGILFIVSSPIGNLGDITFRAIDTLKTVSIIASEDTRRTKKLLLHFGIETPLMSFHDHCENEKQSSIVNRLLQGLSVALISDAGTPLINDPGYKLVRSCISEGIKIVPIPGVSAVITALTVSGLPPDKFLYWGYLSHKGARRRHELHEILNCARTTIVLESPYRIVKMLADAVDIMPQWHVAVCRELTKVYEEVYRGSLASALEHFSKKEALGEFTIVLSPDRKKASEVCDEKGDGE